MIPLRNIVESVRRWFQNLSERERKLVLALGAVFAGLLVLIPAALLSYSIASLDTENREIADILREIGAKRSALEARRSEAQCAKQRYEQPPPALGSFLEAKAKEQGLTVREVTDEPQQEVEGFTRRHVRVTLSGVDLRAAVDLMASVENSTFPVAIEQVQIEHHPPGDKYDLRLGVVAFARGRKGP